MRIGQKFIYKDHEHEIIDIAEGFFYGEVNTLVFHAKDMGPGKKRCVKVKTLERFIEKFGDLKD